MNLANFGIVVKSAYFPRTVQSIKFYSSFNRCKMTRRSLVINLFVYFVDEGYLRRVTIDDEDSSILVYDNWKQVSHILYTHTHIHMIKAILILYLVYFTDTACINSVTH